MEYLEKFLKAIDMALQHGAGLSVMLGLIAALALTQWLKFVLLNTHWLPDPKRWILKAMALPIGAVATYVTWPANGDSTWLKVFIALGVGAAAPYVYQAGTAILSKVAPDIAKKLSADPYDQAPPPPGG